MVVVVVVLVMMIERTDGLPRTRRRHSVDLLGRISASISSYVHSFFLELRCCAALPHPQRHHHHVVRDVRVRKKKTATPSPRTTRATINDGKKSGMRRDSREFKMYIYILIRSRRCLPV